MIIMIFIGEIVQGDRLSMIIGHGSTKKVNSKRAGSLGDEELERGYGV